MGAVDDLDAIANIAKAEDIWFHVDGAFGALATLSPALKPLVKGMERADSIGFDFHKWAHVPYDAPS
jgi:glutamate/tyrosine decarboxylase-like PLP-dependent enzyme